MIAWFYHLPLYFAIVVLIVKRNELSRSNLFDTYARSAEEELSDEKITCNVSQHLHARSADGRCNDLDNPKMGMYLRRFGRNTPIEKTFVNEELLLKPNPRDLANKLLNRTSFIPARTINVLSAAWIQFMVHDWLDHGDPPTDISMMIPLPADDPLRPQGISSVVVPRIPSDPTQKNDSQPKTFLNHNTHWWDGSQLYGRNWEIQKQLRSFEGNFANRMRLFYNKAPIMI